LKHLLSQVRAGGSTGLAGALKTAFANVSNQAVVIVYTDGEPDSKSDVVSVIAEKAIQVNPNEFGILFAQIGNDKSASEFLSYLDDDLPNDIFKKHNIRDLDIVGTKKNRELKAATIEELINEALNG
jgi:hypothetical protein